MDFFKIFDILKLSNENLKLILILSLSALSIVYTVGKSRGKIDVRVTGIETSITDVKNQQAKLNNEILKNRLLNKVEVGKLYKELVLVQNLDKEVIDDKFDLMIKHGIKYQKDRDILYTFFDVLDSKRDSDVSRTHSNTQHNDDTTDID